MRQYKFSALVPFFYSTCLLAILTLNFFSQLNTDIITKGIMPSGAIFWDLAPYYITNQTTTAYKFNFNVTEGCNGAIDCLDALCSVSNYNENMNHTVYNTPTYIVGFIPEFEGLPCYNSTTGRGWLNTFPLYANSQYVMFSFVVAYFLFFIFYILHIFDKKFIYANVILLFITRALFISAISIYLAFLNYFRQSWQIPYPLGNFEWYKFGVSAFFFVCDAVYLGYSIYKIRELHNSHYMWETIN